MTRETTTELDWATREDRVRRVLRGIGLLVAAACLVAVGAGIADLAAGRASGGDLGVLAGFAAIAAAVGLRGWRRGPAPRLEVVRAVIGLAAAAIAWWLLGGAFAGWWPAFLIVVIATAPAMALSGAGRTAGRAVAGADAVALLALGLATGVPAGHLVFEAVAVALSGLVLVELAAELDQSLLAESQKGVELASARSALLAEVEVAQEIQTLLFSEMEVAQRIQTLLLPKAPVFPDHEVAGRMVTAAEVGGDYYDVLSDSADRALLAIGDVSGHGLTSGLTMMMVRTSLVGALEALPAASLPRLYQVLNRCMRRNLDRMDISMYMTFALLEYAGDGAFTAVGRHLPLLVWRRETGEIEEVQLEGMWLGVLDDLEDDQLPVTRFRLAEGDLLFLYTDGIVEQFAGEEMFGFDRLKDVVREHAARGPDDLIDEVLRRLGAFSPEQADDVTMLVVNHQGGVAAARAS